MEEITLALNIEKHFSGDERQKLIINPLKEYISNFGIIPFYLPEYEIDKLGKRTLKPSPIKIILQNNSLEGIKAINSFLTQKNLIEFSKLKFYSIDYDILELFEK